jgi:hypothetical protein
MALITTDFEKIDDDKKYTCYICWSCGPGDTYVVRGRYYCRRCWLWYIKPELLRDINPNGDYTAKHIEET